MKNNTTNKKIFFAFPSFIFWGTLISLIFFSIPPSIIAFVFWQTDLQEGVKILLYVMLVFIFEMFGLSWLLFTDVCTRIVIQDGKIFQKKGWKIIDSFLIEEMVYAEKTFFDKIYKLPL